MSNTGKWGNVWMFASRHSASEMTYIVSSGAFNSTHSLTCFTSDGESFSMWSLQSVTWVMLVKNSKLNIKTKRTLKQKISNRKQKKLN